MAKNGWIDGNWIVVSRELKDKAWVKNPHRFALWIHLLLRAAWKRHTTNYRGHDYDLQPGEFPTTIRQLAKETGLTRGTVERDILWYKDETMIETKTTGGSTLIKILNWAKYQTPETKLETKLGQSLRQGSETLQKKEPKTEQGSSEKTLKKTLQKRKGIQEDVDTVIAYLNLKAERQYKYKISRPGIEARLNEGFTVDDCKKVIDIKCRQWKLDPKMNQYLRPKTLFSKGKFEGYLNQRELPLNPDISPQVQAEIEQDDRESREAEDGAKREAERKAKLRNSQK